MSTVLKKDRKIPEMLILTQAEEIAKDTLHMVNDDSKIPKKYKYNFGNRLVDHSMSTIENLRSANSIYGSSQKKINKRISLGLEAKNQINKFNTDIKLLREISPTAMKQGSKTEYSPWYDEIVEKGIRCEKGINNWINGEEHRLYKILDETKKKQKLKEEEDAKKVNSENEIKLIHLTSQYNKNINDINSIKKKVSSL